MSERQYQATTTEISVVDGLVEAGHCSTRSAAFRRAIARYPGGEDGDG